MVHDDQYLVTHTRVSGLSNAGDEPPHVRPNANRPRLAWCSEERCTKHTGGTSGHVDSRQNGLRGRNKPASEVHSGYDVVPHDSSGVCGTDHKLAAC